MHCAGIGAEPFLHAQESPMRSTIGWAALAVAVVAVYGGGYQASQAIQGSGTLKSEAREVGDFDGVSVGSAMKANVTVGPKTSLKIEADDNLLPLIKAFVSEGHLVVRFEDHTSIRTSSPITLTISTPKLTYIKASGASEVKASGAQADRFETIADGASRVDLSELNSEHVTAKGSGASRVHLAGKGKEIEIHLSGATHLNADEFSADTAQVDASGASGAKMRVTGAVQGNLSGASTLTVVGHPSKRSVKTSGASHASFQ
jgi:hypothetical protein